MANKKLTGSTLVFGIIGLVFIALGIYIFVSGINFTLATIIAVVDVLFGLALIYGSLSSSKNDEQYFDDNGEKSDDTQFFTPVHREPSPVDDLYFDDDEDDDLAEELPTDPSQLAARENELRIAAKRAADEATRAKKTATAAVEEAKRAEAKLRQAEESLSRLEPAEQRAAMRQIDMLAQTAAEKSEIAVNEAKRAKLAIRNAREAAELHSLAMDAAASAISGEDEFAEFN